MARCELHNTVQPCLYCRKGFKTFEGWRDRVEALESLFLSLEEMRSLTRIPLVSPNPHLPMKEIDTSEAIAVVRDVGIGDIVMMHPSLRALKEQNQSRPLVFVTKPENFEVLAGVDYLDAMLPLNAFDETMFYKTFDLCKAMEVIEHGGKITLETYFAKSRPQVIAEALGVENIPRRTDFPCHEGSLSAMRGALESLKRPLIGLAPTCRSPLRVIPPEYVEPLALRLTEYGGTVILLGKTETWSKHLAQIRGRGVKNLIDRLSIRDMIAAVSMLDTIIVPNTGTLHIAGSLGIKTLAIEGNNDPKTFVNIYPSAKAVTPDPKELPCVPCGDQRRTCGLKPGQFGADCMRSITPDRIFQEFQQFYNGRNVAFVRDISMGHVGGAEITDMAIIKQGMDRGFNIRIFNNSTSIEDLYRLFDYELIIVSNCWLFNREKLDIVMKAIKKVPFIRLEHDYRSLEDKPGGKFPKADYADVLFGESALNVFVSPAHRDDYGDMAGESICVFPPLDLELYKSVPGVVRKENSALLGVPRKANLKEHSVRGNADLQRFRIKNPHISINYMNNVVPPDKMPEVYSAYDYFVHLPVVKWSCERVIFEAALCGCKVVTNKNARGVSWGLDLDDPEGLRSWLNEHQDKFWVEIERRFYQGRANEVSGYGGDGLCRVSPGLSATA